MEVGAELALDLAHILLHTGDFLTHRSFSDKGLVCGAPSRQFGKEEHVYPLELFELLRCIVSRHRAI